MPVQVPGNAGRPAASLQYERAETENGYGEEPAPGERGDECAGRTASLKVPTYLPDVRVNARDAVPPEDGRNNYRQEETRR